MKKILRHIAPILMLTIALAPAMQARTWEPVKGDRTTETRTVGRGNDVEVRTARGYIIVSANKPVQIKVYTILGQLVSQETLPAGVSQLRIDTHGVFIVKVAEITCKVAL